MIHVTIPSLIDGQIAKGAIVKLFGKEKNESILHEVDKLDRGLPYNVTLDMSCRMYELSQLQDKTEAFSAKWNEFMAKYGFRGPREVDIRTPRYQDDPTILLKQLHSYAAISADASPQAILKRQTAEREAALKTLLDKVKDKKKLQQLYNVLVNLGGYREIHKYYLVYVGEKIRSKALAIAAGFLKDGRIDALDDIFYLTVQELQKAIEDKTVDARKMIADNKSYMVKVEQIENFPPIIDSRGKILRPKRKTPLPGELIGDPISAGIVKGKAKIINFVGEKDILPGDILVAKAADPGWTPLFINASGILLEVGGMLQHGSLIAREYGKPCI
ncbi:MAG: PEP-utilizing enzyme, partial [Candidatus Saganbacteria bacterium]|nr:PEP-utilizing enzyme [Candidatus Saganbacteria bacterium]